mmetsp:Transcript_2288/g.6144  ORF Transcript_2288/g.6144 Transcript_2288/m.6144 type:complete len:201 (-) Transcript_2288:501-1103(-)
MIRRSSRSPSVPRRIPGGWSSSTGSGSRSTTIPSSWRTTPSSVGKAPPPPPPPTGSVWSRRGIPGRTRDSVPSRSGCGPASRKASGSSCARSGAVCTGTNRSRPPPGRSRRWTTTRPARRSASRRRSRWPARWSSSSRLRRTAAAGSSAACWTSTRRRSWSTPFWTSRGSSIVAAARPNRAGTPSETVASTSSPESPSTP